MPDPAVVLQVLNGARPARPASPAQDKAVFNPIWGLIQDCWAHKSDDRPTSTKIVQRLVDAPIRAKPTQVEVDEYDFGFRRFSQDCLLGYLLDFARVETAQGHA